MTTASRDSAHFSTRPRPLLKFAMLGLAIICTSCNDKSSNAPQTETQSASTPAPFDSIAQANEWMSRYYEHPDPARIPAAFTALTNAGAFDSAQQASVPCTFFAEIFRANPQRIGDWVKQLSSLESGPTSALLQALWLANNDEATAAINSIVSKEDDPRYQTIRAMLEQKPPDVRSYALQTPAAIEHVWAAYSATGDDLFLRRVIDILKLKVSETDPMHVLVGGAAQTTLIQACVYHKRVRERLPSLAAEYPNPTKDLALEAYDAAMVQIDEASSASPSPQP